MNTQEQERPIRGRRRSEKSPASIREPPIVLVSPRKEPGKKRKTITKDSLAETTMDVMIIEKQSENQQGKVHSTLLLLEEIFQEFQGENKVKLGNAINQIAKTLNQQTPKGVEDFCDFYEVN